MTECCAVTGAGRSWWQSRSSSCLPWSGSGRSVTGLMALVNRPRRCGSPRWIPRASSAINDSEFYTACPYENLHSRGCTRIDTPYLPRGINPPVVARSAWPARRGSALAERSDLRPSGPGCVRHPKRSWLCQTPRTMKAMTVSLTPRPLSRKRARGDFCLDSLAHSRWSASARRRQSAGLWNIAAASCWPSSK